MKTLLLKDSSLRVSVMSFHHEIVYSVMRAYCGVEEHATHDFS